MDISRISRKIGYPARTGCCALGGNEGIAPSGHARRILTTTGLAKAFWIDDTEAAAVEACRPLAAG